MKITPIEKDAGFLRQTISDLHEQIDLLSMLQDISKQLISRFDFNNIISLFLGMVKEIIHYNAAALYLHDEQKKCWRLVDRSGADDPELDAIDIQSSIVQWILHEGRWSPLNPEHRTKNSISILPLTGAQKTMGFLLMSSHADRDVFTQSNMKLLSFVASQASIALENQTLYAQLHQSREYIENILESINNGIVTIDMENRVTQINKNATAMLGLPSADIMGTPYHDTFDAPAVAVIDAVRKRTLLDGFTPETVHDFYPTTDLKIPVAISSSLLREPDGTSIGITFVLRDMSASKEIERLRQLDELKSEFVSNVSHELRTPMSIIKSYVEAILNQVSPSDYHTQREFLHIVNNEADRLSNMVSDLLDISRIEAGKFYLDLEEVDIAAVIESVVEHLQGKSTVHTFTTDLSGSLPNITADRDKIYRVFLNVLDNAVKFSPEGGVVSISASTRDDTVTCVIADNGIGIAEPDIEHIFDKFYRADTSDAGNISGTGLGLSIVKHILEEHKGSIDIASSPGSGTSVTIILPVFADYDSGSRTDT